MKFTHQGLSIVLKTSSGEIGLIWLTSANITVNDSRNEEVKTADIIPKTDNVDVIDIHIMCFEDHIDIFVDNLKIINSMAIDENINEHVWEIKIESFFTTKVQEALMLILVATCLTQISKLGRQVVTLILK